MGEDSGHRLTEMRLRSWKGDCQPAVDAYDRLLAPIGRRAAEIAPQPVLAHWPHVGSAYRGTVILGQAVRGWLDDFRADSFCTPEGRARATASVRERNADRADPFDWITTNPVRTSPFWKTSRLLVEELEPDGRRTGTRATAGRISTPALLRTRPVTHGEPSRKPRIRSSASCCERTLAGWTPSLIGFVGPYWWPAAEPAGLADLPEVPGPLLRAGRDADGRTWVIGWHPNGASHRGWGPNAKPRDNSTEYAGS